MFHKCHPNAFAIADFGEGPILTYQKMHSRIEVLSVCLTSGNKRMEFSQLSKPPYLLALIQERPDVPISTVVYRDAPDTVLEQGSDCHLTGQIFAYGRSKDGGTHTLLHAVYLPAHSNIFACIEQKNSLFLESHPEVCEHLLVCGAMMDALLRQNTEDYHENKRM